MDTHNAETTAIVACGACGTGLLATDKFCRRCGISQKWEKNSEKTAATQVFADNESGLTTNIEPTIASQQLYHRVSGPLVRAIVSSVAESNTSRLTQTSTGFLKSSIVALVLVPIWMIIVLLSPLDAYVAARTLTRTI
jgi:hypothetical protein